MPISEDGGDYHSARPGDGLGAVARLGHRLTIGHAQGHNAGPEGSPAGYTVLHEPDDPRRWAALLPVPAAHLSGLPIVGYQIHATDEDFETVSGAVREAEQCVGAALAAGHVDQTDRRAVRGNPWNKVVFHW